MSLRYRLRDELNMAMIRQRIRHGREWLRKHNLLMGVIFLLCIVLSWSAILYARFKPTEPPPRRVPMAWYWDLNTGEKFIAPAGFAAVDAPSGPLPNGAPAGVRAFVYACGSCDDAGARKTAYLTMRTPAAPTQPVDGVLTFDARKDQVIAEPASHLWHPLGSEAGRALLRAPAEDCKDKGPVIECLPDAR